MRGLWAVSNCPVRGQFKGCGIMLDYQKMYHILYYAVAGAERRNSEASKLLREALDECDKLYIESLDTSGSPNVQPKKETAGE